jgi:hypothetical protein
MLLSTLETQSPSLQAHSRFLDGLHTERLQVEMDRLELEYERLSRIQRRRRKEHLIKEFGPVFGRVAFFFSPEW